jgi:dynein heavy chain
MAGCVVSEIEPRRNCNLREFRKEVFEKMLYPAGVEGKQVTFLFTDNHVLQESFLEEVNNLINTGDMELERDLLEKMKKDIELVMV